MSIGSYRPSSLPFRPISSWTETRRSSSARRKIVLGGLAVPGQPMPKRIFEGTSQRHGPIVAVPRRSAHTLSGRVREACRLPHHPDRRADPDQGVGPAFGDDILSSQRLGEAVQQRPLEQTGLRSAAIAGRIIDTEELKKQIDGYRPLFRRGGWRPDALGSMIGPIIAIRDLEGVLV